MPEVAHDKPVGIWKPGLVAALRTKPETVTEDLARLMDLAGAKEALPREAQTLLKINISWHHYYPACSTTPWQFDGVAQALINDGWKPEDLIPAQNSTVVVDPEIGSVNNHLVRPAEKHGLEFVWLYKPGVEWITYEPIGEMLCLPEIFPQGIRIPKMFIGKNAIQMPTVKTHVFTTTTGAMKNAFGGLLDNNRHWTHSRIHETLVDLLTIQREIHPGLLAVMDGTIAGSGPGPRAMVPHVKNILLASADQVAIDALAAKVMGFDPLKIDYIRLAHEKGLGVGDPREIEVVGHPRRGLALHRGRHPRQPRPEVHLPRLPEALREAALADADRAVELRGEQAVPRCLLVPVRRQGAGGAGDGERVGQAVRGVCLAGDEAELKRM
jgi:uncharacterized protein (DUF362 family)